MSSDKRTSCEAWCYITACCSPYSPCLPALCPPYGPMWPVWDVRHSWSASSLVQLLITLVSTSRLEKTIESLKSQYKVIFNLWRFGVYIPKFIRDIGNSFDSMIRRNYEEPGLHNTYKNWRAYDPTPFKNYFNKIRRRRRVNRIY